jgi:hypothetical protein
LRRSFGAAELVPYAWHLVTHATEDGIAGRSSRTLSGPAHAFGHLQATREVKQAWNASLVGLQALESTKIVVRTPVGISPGPVGRKRLRSFVEEHQTPSVQIVWEPQGIWETAQAIDFARSLRIPVLVSAFDGAQPCWTSQDIDASVWLRVDGLGGPKGRVGTHQLDQLIELYSERPNVTVVFAGTRAFQNLRNMRREFASSS